MSEGLENEKLTLKKLYTVPPYISCVHIAIGTMTDKERSFNSNKLHLFILLKNEMHFSNQSMVHQLII